MTEVMDVRAVQHGLWWMVSVPGMPGLVAQVSSLEPRHLGAVLASAGAGTGSDGGDIAVRRVEQVAPVAAPQGAALSTRQDGGRQGREAATWTQQAVRATRRAPRRVAELLAG
jgi:hypothetical protein